MLTQNRMHEVWHTYAMANENTTRMTDSFWPHFESDEDILIYGNSHKQKKYKKTWCGGEGRSVGKVPALQDEAMTSTRCPPPPSTAPHAECKSGGTGDTGILSVTITRLRFLMLCNQECVNIQLNCALMQQQQQEREGKEKVWTPSLIAFFICQLHK